MSARATAAACAGLLAAFALAGSAPAKGDEPPPPERVMARGYEFGLTLSRQKVSPGRAIIQFVNDGEDPHDLRLQRAGETIEVGVGEIGPGDYANLETRLRRRSTYVLWCSLGEHRAKGMEATLRTKRRPR